MQLKRYTSYLLLFQLLGLICFSQTPNYAKYVNPFIGTGGAGHTFPGALVPFGMVQLSPDTRIDWTWEGCGGYHYSDSIIYGFTHTHVHIYAYIVLTVFRHSSSATIVPPSLRQTATCEISLTGQETRSRVLFQRLLCSAGREIRSRASTTKTRAIVGVAQATRAHFAAHLDASAKNVARTNGQAFEPHARAKQYIVLAQHFPRPTLLRPMHVEPPLLVTQRCSKG